MMTVKSIHKAASDLLQKCEQISIPVDPERIAQFLGIRVVAYPMGNKVSGMLAIESTGATIGYNEIESKHRQRFTIAHELGHFILHNNQDTSRVFVDNQFKVDQYIQVLFRKNEDTEEPITAQMEIEANNFAAALLMPEAPLLVEIEKMEFDLGDDNALKDLSEKFNVSSSAMYYRLLNLRKP